MGAAVWIVLGCSRLFTTSLLYLYVLGHELTHVLAVYCSRGSVSKFNASLTAATFKTDKNNLFISLSPLFPAPLGHVVGLGLGNRSYLLAHHHLRGPTLLRPGVLVVLPSVLDGMDHSLRTSRTWPATEPSSLILVYFANLLLFLGLLRLFNAVSINRFLADCLHNAERLGHGQDLALFTADCSCKNTSSRAGNDERRKPERNPIIQNKGSSHAHHTLDCPVPGRRPGGLQPKETVKALTSDQNVTQEMAVRFAENMVGLPRALVVSEARKAAPGEKSP